MNENNNSGINRTYIPGQSVNESTSLNFEIKPPPNTVIPEIMSNKTEGNVINVLPVPEHEDSFRNKILQYIQGPESGLCDIVERTILVNGRPNLIFKSGFQAAVDVVNKNMIPIDVAGTYVPALQAQMDAQQLQQPVANMNEQNFMNVNPYSGTVRQTPVVQLSPIAQILQKRKSSIVELKLTIKLDLPSANLFNMLLEEFEATPEEIFNECLNEKNLVLLKSQVSEALLNKYCPDYQSPKKEVENAE